MTTPDDSRGGSAPPRPPAGKPQQWFTFRPWVFDVTLAGIVLRANPRPTVLIPVQAWARAYGLDRDPAGDPDSVSLIGPGPGFSPDYAMTTDPGEPVILATLADADGRPMPLLIDGCHRLHKAAVTGREKIPAFILTPAETALIRSDAVLGPTRPAPARPQPTGTAPRHREERRPAMLTGLTTRTRTPREDDELWPGGTARPVLDYLATTAGMTGEDAEELLRAARAAHADIGPGSLVECPLPARNAHLLIHYAPGSRAYRLKLTTPPPGSPPGGREPAPAGEAAEPGTARVTVTIWHNVAFDDHGRHVAMLDGYQPGDPMVAVFAYQTNPGRLAEEIADEAFAIFNDDPPDAAGADLAWAYRERRLRSLSAGDVVGAGDILLAVGRPAGWEPVAGPLAEVRVRTHGTSPLPGCGRPAAGEGGPR